MAPRLTFRDKTPDVCYQKQVRDSHNAEGVPAVPHLDVKRSVVRPISRRMAEQVILRYEWLGTMANTQRHFGLFFGSHIAGAECYSLHAPAGATRMPYGLSVGECATLERGACVHWAPAGSNSRLVAITARLLAKDGVRLLLAYADSDAGEIGTIYQACGWWYVGATGKDTEWVAPNGERRHRRYVSQQASRRKETCDQIRARMLTAGWKQQQVNRKHRYVYPLDREMAAALEPLRQPYPKRAASIGTDASAVHVEEGGETPTAALHLPQ